MANKKTPEAGIPAQVEQLTASPKVFAIEQLRSEKKINRAVFAGVCAAQGWRPGKTVTEAEFLQAVENFTAAPMSGAAKKEEAAKYHRHSASFRAH